MKIFTLIVSDGLRPVILKNKYLFYININKNLHN